MPSQGYLSIGAIQPRSTTGASLSGLSIGAVQPGLVVSASLTATLGSLTLAGSATTTVATTTASLSATLGSLTASATATSTVTLATTATLSATLGSLTLSGSATTARPSTTGSLSVTLGSVTLTSYALGYTKTFEQSLVDELKSMSGLTALVGTRIYESVIPHKMTLPALVYQTSTEFSEPHLTGQSNTRDETVTFDLISETRETTRAILDQIENHFVMADYRGILGGAGGVYVAETTLGDVDSDDMRLADGTDRPVRISTITLTMRYAQP